MTNAKKILCIEDDREIAALIAEEFAERGYKTIVAYDGREGLAAILKETPDLVLCDICMRSLSGFEVLEHLIRIAPRFVHMPFVFLTSLTDHASQFRARQLGVNDYLVKPIDFDVLGAIVTARLAKVLPTSVPKRVAQTPSMIVPAPMPIVSETRRS
jgi:DNA-binding response OmpR family regulator